MRLLVVLQRPERVFSLGFQPPHQRARLGVLLGERAVQHGAPLVRLFVLRRELLLHRPRELLQQTLKSLAEHGQALDEHAPVLLARQLAKLRKLGVFAQHVVEELGDAEQVGLARSGVPRRLLRRLALRDARLLLLRLELGELVRVLVPGLLDSLAAHQPVVQVLELARARQDVRRVVLLVAHRVPGEVGQAQRGQRAQRIKRLEVFEFVLAEAQRHERVFTRLKTLDGVDLVVVQRQILELDEAL
mmetsp:Transcript_8738/g.36892  ORF Transcript_8738/g.36892 Transcript_8738/m.36892 type:complete len:246 (-) Transcript_8738:392-1129(-)